MSFDKAKKEEKNILLANAIENYEILYDPHNPFYTNRLEQDKAWQDVARQMNESVTSCKENWRSLRNSFVRDLRLPPLSNTNARRKSYYMSEHLQFLVPFLPTKQRQNHAARTFGTPYDSEDGQEYHVEKVDVSDNHDSTNEEMEGAVSDSSGNFDNLDRFENSTKRHKRNKASFNYFERAADTKGLVSNRMDYDPDFDFLRSLLPDFKKLPDQSKLRFKIKTLELLSQFLYSEDPVAGTSLPVSTISYTDIKKENLSS